LIWACENGNQKLGPEIVQELLKAGADPLKEDSNGLTALERLCMTSGNPLCARFLLEYGARLVNKVDKKRTSTTLMLAALNGKKDLVIELVDRWGADVFAKTEHGQTAYSFAVGNAHNTVAELLQKRMSSYGDSGLRNTSRSRLDLKAF
jgi:ankyrin repeat protein